MWILKGAYYPCDQENVVITVDTQNGRIVVPVTWRLGKWHSYELNCNIDDNAVVAWMPFPDPYKDNQPAKWRMNDERTD